MQNKMKYAGLLLLALLPELAAAETLPSLDARFETTQCAVPCQKPVKREWLMLREAGQVELRDVNAGNSELWQQQADGSLEYSYLIHGQKRAINYNPIDLRLLGINADQNKWQALTRLVTANDLASLEKKPGQPYQQTPTEVYQGKLNGIETAITWIPALAIPLQVEYRYPRHEVTVKLVERYQGDKLPVAKTTEATLDAYQHVDFTDIGDMEHDKNALVWLAEAKGAPGVHVHQHGHNDHHDHQH
ncbi:hypothetical protein LG198_04810 [Methylobacillus arboreus]|uniref:hypothetical protein n=1 Tax=Methylobacillus arboreus TaxID=755170 RepID=UPI001E352797|nr:hypothetical protein [Methylobacillus arboreus]MCB5190049.1 hypothetical protein [Methylobacillus arboreus]